LANCLQLQSSLALSRTSATTLGSQSQLLLWSHANLALWSRLLVPVPLAVAVDLSVELLPGLQGSLPPLGRKPALVVQAFRPLGLQLSFQLHLRLTLVVVVALTLGS